MNWGCFNTYYWRVVYIDTNSGSRVKQKMTTPPIIPSEGEVVCFINEDNGHNIEGVVTKRHFIIGKSHMTIEVIIES